MLRKIIIFMTMLSISLVSLNHAQTVQAVTPEAMEKVKIQFLEKTKRAKFDPDISDRAWDEFFAQPCEEKTFNNLLKICTNLVEEEKACDCKIASFFLANLFEQNEITSYMTWFFDEDGLAKHVVVTYQTLAGKWCIADFTKAQSEKPDFLRELDFCIPYKEATRYENDVRVWKFPVYEERNAPRSGIPRFEDIRKILPKLTC